ncbi:SRPBCC family protein [Melittangium boletus]|uniref:START domain-containing protein n=1 Tax=Melittangium boletus DSM 14713 TaxID=1294270 RepID=A0A250IC75_9BACT|nr:SRPBCC family protein [Melittangium boletus]ATB29355.1 hypothetical protein MEBOL_002804 [Melittangium boletus DSM 14713]
MWHAMGGLLLVMALVAGDARAAESTDWKTVSTGDVVIRVRPRVDIPGGREFWAEGDMDVELPSIRSALKDHEKFRRWMPHVTESRVLSEADGGGSRVTYTQLDLPIISNRDYVLRVEEQEGRDDEGRETFQQRWSPANDVLPERRGVVRLLRNAGSWFFTAKPEGGVHFVYRFTVEPGGSIPGFLAGVGQTDAVMDTVRAVERRARQLSAEDPAR